MQNPIPKLRNTSIISKKPGFLSEKFKTLTSSNYHGVKYFLLKFCTRFLLTNVYKAVCGIYIIMFRSWVINKSVKNECVEPGLLLFLQITEDLNKIKKITHANFVDIGK